MRNVASAVNRSNPSRNIDEEIEKNRFFLFLTGLEHCVSLAHESCVADKSCRIFLTPAKLASFDDRPED